MSATFWDVWNLFDSGGSVPMCAWCGRIRLEESWDWAPHGALEAIDDPTSLTHSICPACLAAQLPAPAGPDPSLAA